MEASYLKVPDIGTGYFPTLRNFRTLVPLGTKAHFGNIDVIVEGELPGEIGSQLPFFGVPKFITPNLQAYNSGGRGVLLSNGETHLRFKGNDVDGSITRIVAESKKNNIPDIRMAADRIKDMPFNTASLHSGSIYKVPSYDRDRPFSFFTRASAENEKLASTIIGDGFEAKGFARPYSFQARIVYPTIHWQGKQLSTLVFKMPSMESDFRFQEIWWPAFQHLKFASPDELLGLKDELGSFLERLTTWHGFVSAIMAEGNLAPTVNSHQHQNYVITNVTETEIGASRVDHTSTVVNSRSAAQYAATMEQQFMWFADINVILLHALQLAGEGKLDEERYTGYYDMAYKWRGEFKPSEISGMEPYIRKVQKAWNRGFKSKDPVPIPEHDLTGIIQKILAVRIDKQKQIRVYESHYRKFGLTIPSDYDLPDT